MDLLSIISQIVGVLGTLAGMYFGIFKLIQKNKQRKERSLKENTDYVLQNDKEFYESFFKFHVREELFAKGTGIKIPHQYQAGLLELYNKFKGKYSWDKIRACHRYFVYENAKVTDIQISDFEILSYWVNTIAAILLFLAAGFFYFLLEFIKIDAKEKIIYIASFTSALSYSAFFLYMSSPTYLARKMKKDFKEIKS